MGLNKPNNEIDTSMLAQESTSQEIKLSNESIKAVADEILNKIGLTSDAGGGATAGSVFAKLNALLTQTASGGSSGWSDFKITDKSISGKSRSFSYTTTHPAIVISRQGVGERSYPISFNITVASFTIAAENSYGGAIDNDVISFVPSGTTISGRTGSSSGNNYCNCIIAEFI